MVVFAIRVGRMYNFICAASPDLRHQAQGDARVAVFQVIDEAAA
jgi:hypothetical protein